MSKIFETGPLGFPWATIDPFLFCAYHDDHYPRGTATMAPAASLAGRRLGNDFAGKDGWRMYHGTTVPGFPQHPHRGFETVTIVRRGIIDHSDSLGATARFGKGDVQWLTAGSGIVHCEMFPLLDEANQNPLELFQIWLNLPARDKLVPPHFSMLWGDTLPRVVRGEGTIVVVAGTLGDRPPPAPPPHSWAAQPDADVAIWTVDLPEGGATTLPPATGKDTIRTLYFFKGGELTVDDRRFAEPTAMRVDAHAELPLRAERGHCELLVLQGRPIAEPVAQYGPFVMNTEREIQQAFADYRQTQFGGWPWPSDDPVHPRDAARFARHADGKIEKP